MPTYGCNRLGHAYGCCDAEDLPEKIEQNPLFRYLQKWLVRLNESRFADEVKYFSHDAVAFKTTPLKGC